MANRYANLTPSKKISEDFQNITIGFDKVQQDVDGLAGQIDDLDTLSPADRAKLDGIEDGAQVNQNAYAKVNGMEADDPSDEVTIEGGTGITVTQNPNEKKVTITATGEATPGPHGSAHLEFGSDPIPYATVTDGGLMSAEDKQSLEALEADTSSRAINAKYPPPPLVGMTGDEVTDDLPALNAIKSFAVSNGYGKIYVPQGKYLLQGKFEMDAVGLTLEGTGIGNTILWFANDDGIELSENFTGVKNIYIRHVPPSPSDGAGIRVVNNAAFCIFDKVGVDGFFYNFDFVAARSWNLVDSYIHNAVKYNVYVRNTVSPDSGDQVIQGCTLDSSVDTEAAIRHESGGGLKIYGNKILRHKIGYDLQVADDVVTSVSIIDGNSIEMQSVHHIRAGRIGTTGLYKMIVISNNQHNRTASIESGYRLEAGLDNVTINGNVSEGLAGVPFIDLQGGLDYIINGNHAEAWGTGVKIGSGAAGVNIGTNGWEGIPKPIEDNTPRTIGRPTNIRHRYVRSVHIESDSTYTNLYKLDLATFRGCEVEVLVEGVLSGVGVVSRKVDKLISRASAACTVTDVSDVNGGSAIDVQFDTATTSGSVIIGMKRNTGAGGTALDVQVTLQISGHVQGVNLTW